MQRLLQLLIGRLGALLSGFLVNRIERHLLEEEIDDVLAMEQKARQLEADGMADLATKLRSRLADIDARPNCGRGQAILEEVAPESAIEPRLLDYQPGESKMSQPKRPRRRRSALAEERDND